MKKILLPVVFLLLSAFCLRGQEAWSFDTDPASGYLQRKVFGMPMERDSVFIVISKVRPLRLCVYEKRRRDTILLAVYPCALSAVRGQKVEEGDCRTPESWPRRPYRIWTITDLRKVNQVSSKYRMYGPYYHALAVPGVVGVAIHGTNSPASIAWGRVSHGCIRLYNDDCEHLRDHYSQIGTRVTILPENKGPLPFEERSLDAIATDPQNDACSIACGSLSDCVRYIRPCARIHCKPWFDKSRLGF